MRETVDSPFEATTTAETAAERWARRLGERKVHVVSAVLDLVGEDEMERIANEAREVHARGEALSLGGAFMRVLKTIVVFSTATETSTGSAKKKAETLHDVAKRVGGEREIQRIRRRRKKRPSHADA